MFEPSLYHDNNHEAHYILNIILQKYMRLMKWNHGGETILDIGCGPADVTTEILLPKLPTTFKCLIACDISDAMLNFARTHHPHPKVKYEQLSICENIPKDLTGIIDHVFSFYCLQFMEDQRKIFQNIFQLLKPGGDFLIVHLSDDSTYDAHETLAKSSKWREYLRDYEKLVSPFHNCTDIEKTLEKILIETGFQTKLCKLIDHRYAYPSINSFKDLVRAVDPFAKLIPSDQLDDYAMDITNLHEFERREDNETLVYHKSKLLVMVATKPE